jgi:hypothetical protein
MDLLIFIKHFVTKVVMNFVLISINLWLIIKLSVTKAFMNLFKTLLDLLIFIKHFVAKVVMNFIFISINLLLIIKLFTIKVVMNLFKILWNIVHFFAKNEFNWIFVFCRRFDFDVPWIQCLWFDVNIRWRIEEKNSSVVGFDEVPIFLNSNR